MKISNPNQLLLTLPLLLWSAAVAQPSDGQGPPPQGGQGQQGQGQGPPPQGGQGQGQGQGPPQQGGGGGGSGGGGGGQGPPQQGGGSGGGGGGGSGGGPPSTTYEPYTIEGTPCGSSSSSSSKDFCTSWIFNTDGQQTSNNFGSALVDVEAVTLNDDESEVTVYAHGIPNYKVSVTQDLVDSLNNRPLASADFVSGTTTVQAGEVVDFGANIGYNTARCELGYWPPGPECPDSTYKALTFPTTPQEAVSDGDICEVGLGVLGLFVNGVSIFGWGDGASYKDEFTWMNLAVKFEIFDLDICNGHAANKEYHHHDYSQCVQNLLGDDGASGHSPIIGMMGDGYFLYGKHQEVGGVKAQSCWKTRDYTNPDDPLGCGGTGTRTCVLVDNKDPNAGTTPATKDGPTVTETVQSLSGNSFVVETGYYYQDWYFDADCYAQGGEYLDEHNGHSHGDYGYHYHATESFPYHPGPDTLYGVVVDKDSFCKGTVGPNSGNGGGGSEPNRGGGTETTSQSGTSSTHASTTTFEANPDANSSDASSIRVLVGPWTTSCHGLMVALGSALLFLL